MWEVQVPGNASGKGGLYAGEPKELSLSLDGGRYTWSEPTALQ